MIEFITSIDTKIFLAINGAHADFLDFVMYWVSNRAIWAPFYVFLVYLLFMHYKKQAWVILPLAILLIAFSDQTSVHFFKDVFHRLRPCHDPDLTGMVRLVDGNCGGQYGFISSHATNAFALAVFVGTYLDRKIRGFLVVMLIWATVIGYSRVYLGVHYPLDVIAGALWGSLLAYGMLTWSRNLLRKG